MLRGSHGIAVRADYVLAGKDDDSALVYGVTDRVYQDDPLEQEGFEEQREALLIALCSYFTDVASTLDPETGQTRFFLTDIIRYEEQFVYGHTAADPEPKFRLVDIDPGEIDNHLDTLYAVVEEMVRNSLTPLVVELQQQGKSVEFIRVAAVRLLGALSEAHANGKQQDSRYFEQAREAIKLAFSSDQ